MRRPAWPPAPGKPLVVGHRGGRGDGWPRENTIAAFRRALAQGAPAIELDVRSCADEVVTLHDATLERATQGADHRVVADLAWAEVETLALEIPRLSDVLAWASESGCGLNVEIKRDVPNRLALVRRVAVQLRAARIPILVSSFDPYVLLAVRTIAPPLPCALITDPSQSYAGLLHELARPGLLFGLNVERRQADAARVARWKRRGLAVGVWTVNDPDEARRLARAGVDALITDEPARIREALG